MNSFSSVFDSLNFVVTSTQTPSVHKRLTLHFPTHFQSVKVKLNTYEKNEIPYLSSLLFYESRGGSLTTQK